MVWKRFRGRAYPKCANPECPKNAAKKSAKGEEDEKSSVKEKKTRKKASSDAKEA